MNKEQLTLEQKATYFPYGVRGIKEDTGEIYELTSLTLKNETWTPILFGDATNKPCKIALRPLSQLTEEIEHNGEKFVPIEKFKCINEYLSYQSPNEDCPDAPKEWCFNNHNRTSIEKMIKILSMLYSWKFDVKNLIEKKLAIDVTKLETNPYK